jgi:hypothetical protein
MHGWCAGFQSEEEILAKSNVDVETGLRVCRCPKCAAAVSGEGGDKSASIINSRATQIVTPPAILEQWQKEISRHTKDWAETTDRCWAAMVDFRKALSLLLGCEDGVSKG